ncbi:MAG: VWA domain-containing protein [Candidatus Thermoplasmatota archaeon]|nr:VWA domain-containing protein [Candidatus Thermoplasmatota archaeon]
MIGISLLVLICCSVFAAQGSDAQSSIPKIDLVFVIDTTGSMSDEIREVKMHIRNVIEDVLAGTPQPDLWIGFVIYRDYLDQESEYVYKIYPLASDIDTIMENLEGFIAAGGGDYEEVVTIGLDVALNEMNWRVTDTNGTERVIIGYDENQNPIYSSSGPITKMIFLIGDAEPRTREYPGSQDTVHSLPLYTETIKDAISTGISIYTISCSGMSAAGEAIWQEIAEQTGGKYEQLTYVRKNIQVYIEEEDLDPHWEESVKGMSDYSPADGGTILTNSLGSFVRSAVLDEAVALGVRYGNASTPEGSYLYVGDIGYLSDVDNDSVFETFYSNTTENTTTVHLENGIYFIDDDGDGSWEYTYSGAAGVVPYSDEIVRHDVLLIIFLIIIGSIVGIVVVHRKH